MTLALIQQAAPNTLVPQLILFGGLGLMFYFLLIRPQNKARKEMEARLSKLKSGDEVLLSSGFYATIDRVEEKAIWLKLGGNLVKARKNAVVALSTEQAPEQN